MNEMDKGSSNPQDNFEYIKAVMRAHEDELLNKANVVGIGIGFRRSAGETTTEPALVVMVSRKLPAWQVSEKDLIPASIDGIPVDVQEVGQITAQ
jgi:hypothetical protein